MGFFKRSASYISIKSPLQGRFVALTDVPDEVFAGKVLGDGFAIDPSDGLVLSPVDAEVAQVFRTNHAIGLKTEEGLEILIHIGLDTVKLNGEGFTCHTKAGQKVKTGDKLLSFDLNLIKTKAKSAISPIVITNMDVVKDLKFLATGQVERGQELLRVEKK